jgi:CheY-like chemotaxis protein
MNGGPRVGRDQSEGVFLPRAQMDDGLETPNNSIPEAPADRRGEIILLVDDDNAVREVTALILRDLGSTVLEVGSGGAALEVLSGEPHVDLVVLDFAMPGMNGIEVARQVQVRVPSLPVLFVTGYADKDALSVVSEGQIVRKPFVGEELAIKVGASLTNRTCPSAKIIRLEDDAREPATASTQRPRQNGPCSVRTRGRGGEEAEALFGRVESKGFPRAYRGTSPQGRSARFEDRHEGTVRLNSLTLHIKTPADFVRRAFAIEH